MTETNLTMNPIKPSLIPTFLLLLLLLLLIQSPHFSKSTHEIITPSGLPFKDGDLLISAQQNFALGFFTPAAAAITNSSLRRRYLGIWYLKVSEHTVVWVANRDDPIHDNSGLLSFNTLGNNLILYPKNQTINNPVWSTNVSTPSTTNCTARLLDSGNFILVREDGEKSTVLWQSFDYPTDTLLPEMKLGVNFRTDLNRLLSSWKSEDDPGTGSVFYKIDPIGFPQLFLYKGKTRWWRGGPWTGLRWSGVPEMTRSYIFNVVFVNNASDVYVSYGMNNASIISRMVVNESGAVQRLTWNDHDRKWIGIWSAPKEQCDEYNQCGPNSICDPYEANDFICKCLPGFGPKAPHEWYLRDGSGGCLRNPGVSVCKSGEGFVKVGRVRVPDTSTARANMSLNLKDCDHECLMNCSCSAYTSADERGIGCLRWEGDLIDTRRFSDVGQDIYVRVDATELAKYEKSKGPLAKHGLQALLIVSVAVTLFLIAFLVYWFIRRKRKAQDSNRKSLLGFTSSPLYSGSSQYKNELVERTNDTDLPIFDISTISAATNDFSNDNKLGEGGFGSVYKGRLQNGQEIAVKRLSQYSGQGIDEFRNEVELIAKLQHRNLVRILGCCINDREKMLVYEYLPNKSLDFFIFDGTNRAQLDWPTRHNIICGIARGILYLHQDSRLRIIHRDLKASNVLLDASMNPKISDFGMARIFGVDQIEANTNRVVGTYGYMSPEYAMQGKFSEKSDVYSFGVLLLEVITGQKNSSYYQESTSMHLVGYVWDLWKEGRAKETIDSSLGDAYPEQEVLRCIQIGLLCVQDSAMDRPSMSSVVFMLSNDTVLPSPKQPAFILRRSYNNGDPSSSTTEGANSVNDVTVSMLEAR